jgi:hypothetical protein
MQERLRLAVNLALPGIAACLRCGSVHNEEGDEAYSDCDMHMPAGDGFVMQ